MVLKRQLDRAGHEPVRGEMDMNTVVRQYPEIIPLLEHAGVVCFR